MYAMAKEKHDGHRHHEHRPGIGSAHEAGPDGAGQVADQHAHHADHHARIDPVIEVRAPADDELGKARVAPGGLVVEKRLLREIIGTAGAGIELGHFRVADGGGQAEQQGEDDAGPHGGSGGAGRALGDECQPKKGAGRDQRHGVHRQAGQAQRRFHGNFGFVCHKSLLNSSISWARSRRLSLTARWAGSWRHADCCSFQKTPDSTSHCGTRRGSSTTRRAGIRRSG